MVLPREGDPVKFLGDEHMETWGELFWDAWIRLRLACRRLYRTYWPPHFKTWQVCTATGIVSIILTLVVLNLPSGKSDLQAKNEEPAGTENQQPTTGTSKAGSLATSSDPFAEPDLTEASSTAADEGLVPPAQAEPLDSEFAEPLVTKPRRTEVAAVDFPATEAPNQALAFDDAGADQPTLAAPLEGDTQAAMPATDLVAEGDDPVVATEPTASEPEAQTEMPAELTLPAETEQPSVASEPDTAAQPPVLELPDRDPDHYGRFGDEKEEDRQSTNNIRVTRIKDLPPAKQHTPFAMPIRPKSSYSRLGHHEDSEEDRHSVRAIRPTRTDSVPIPGGNVVVQAPKSEPADAANSEAQSASPTLELPPVPMDNGSTEPMVPAATEEDQGNGFELPSSEPATRNLPPVKQNDNLFVPEPATLDMADDEPAATEPPPVLFAPETEAGPVEADVPAPRKQSEFHGPAKSTEPTNHEAHQEEDEFSLPARKTAPAAKVVPPVAPDQPLATEEQKPVVVKPTDPTTHEAHQDEDAFSRPVRKTFPESRVVPPTVEEHPVESKTLKPDSDEAAETATTPRTPRRTTPHIVHDYDETPTAPKIDEDSVPPMAVTRPRNSERVTIPERIPAEALPTEPVLPLGRDDSEFAPAATTVKPSDGPRLVMEITGPQQVPVGTQVVLHFKLQNIGTAPATGIVVTDVLPAGLQHRLSSDLEYAVARLNPGETRETNLTVQCVSRGTIVNRAALRADGDVTAQAEIQLEVTDATAGSSSQARTTQSPLTINHHGPERWLVDSTGQFLVTVTNHGSQTLKNVTISQTYPQGTNLIHATVGHKTDEKNRTVSWTISEFAPGVSYILETELHSLTSGPATSIARIKVGDTEVVEDRWTAVSYSAAASAPATRR